MTLSKREIAARLKNGRNADSPRMLPWAKSKALAEGKRKAVAYYRHSAQDRQENSIDIQREQVHKFADEHSIEIIHEFADRGKTGLCAEGRDAFNEMLHDFVVEGKEDFNYVLVLDVSRWGRFQDTDLSASDGEENQQEISPPSVGRG